MPQEKKNKPASKKFKPHIKPQINPILTKPAGIDSSSLNYELDGFKSSFEKKNYKITLTKKLWQHIKLKGKL